MKNLSISVFSILILCFNPSQAQNIEYAHEVINELCSDEMAGRGYVNDGDNAAAFYIEQQFQKLGLKAWDFDYNQAFSFPVNTFPAQVKFALNGVDLQPGNDFIVSPGCPTANGEYEIIRLTEIPTINDFGIIANAESFKKKAVVMEDSIYTAIRKSGNNPLKLFKNAGAKIVVQLTDKLTWSVAQKQDIMPMVQVLRTRFNFPQRISINIKAEFVKKHRTQNVIGYLEGTEEPDKFIVFTGHYDHLGMMGSKAMFKGANDNASGIAMMLNLAEYYSDAKNRPKYSIAFIAFAGEEAGLMGSFYYVKNPVFPLWNIKFLMNVDLLGTGEDGITVVNGAVHSKEFATLVDLNEKNGYLKQVKKRGKAANSDHYPFSEAGVPAFFIYTMGGITAYHDVFDLPETLPLTEFEDVFRLIRDFISTLDQK